MAASLIAIAASPDIENSRSDLAAAFAVLSLNLLLALLMTAPTYFVLAFGLLRDSMHGMNPPALTVGSSQAFATSVSAIGATGVSV